ncbi:enoyl-CoA hydratase/isomerase family protein [Gordonia insulae]|uniref:Putative enoyl-CoA hydratase n=1 Tax=Gordonia insulae TaxID=2420509 RepID=A0A3G8JKY1_9ACTN|nr:enoyl-CoA hydratase/isomerase family protein [Gordonia insulae]AZG45741.1 putative enoyl-CoA hydratase [Gordonia insulae]
MVKLETVDGLAVITIDRPEARNAIAQSTMDELDHAIDEAAGARALAITGGGDRVFVSGGDLKQLAALRTLDDARAMAWRMRTICQRLVDFPAPVIAALNGHALGGGAEFATAADIRLAADDIKIGFNQSTLQIMPAWGGAERLATLVGRPRALLLAGGGRLLSAEEAHGFGLVDEVFPRETFDHDWRAVAESLASAPAAAIKRVLNGATADDAVEEFATLWVADAHWAAADRVLKRSR